jgi:hypothetical protein
VEILLQWIDDLDDLLRAMGQRLARYCDRLAGLGLHRPGG